MKYIFIASAVLALSCTKNQPITEKPEVIMEQQKNVDPIYQFKVKDITGGEFNLADLKGKKVLIVNTASKCGLTPQFEQLEELYQKYKDQNFVIIGFPTNDFMSQDPGTNEEIAEFCKLNYGVTFPMMSKIVVKGDNKEPLYQYLTQKDKNGLGDFDVEWNFQKFLINEEGKLAKVINPKVSPTDAEITNWIEGK
ncbi:glutathione peroxidase [Paenimyroides ummariense]|uniref:Glutathione peroxidase n=2 Tax=Paenimyroides ummariense TaxID=913024 RepID=A0A1I5GR30_9FLAO|nr:glutathione peroxidase [Paenimyroides ummariense]